MFYLSVLKFGKLNIKVCISFFVLFCYKSPEITWFMERMSYWRIRNGAHSFLHHAILFLVVLIHISVLPSAREGMMFIKRIINLVFHFHLCYNMYTRP